MGDLNLWNADDISERFYSSKTRQFHATHLSTGDRLWSCFPFLRPMATITADTSAGPPPPRWLLPRAVRTYSPSPVRYGMDEDGGGVHDVIGSRCDPTPGHLQDGVQPLLPSNLTRSLVERGVPVQEAQGHVHDVLMSSCARLLGTPVSTQTHLPQPRFPRSSC